MKKKTYIPPRIKQFTYQVSHMLMVSPSPSSGGGTDTTEPDEVELPWSGTNSGTAGPDAIDEYSTFDSF